jgi:Reverse transcriptase (RNA-dependent DNA polymerase)
LHTNLKHGVVKVFYIPKAGTKDPGQPKSYRTISLTSFLLKAKENLIDLHRSKYLVRHTLHKIQFAHQAGKSTVSALHHLVTKIEEALRCKEVALSTFVDNQGAFDNRAIESIKPAAVSRQIDPESVEWIIGMLECRIFTADLGEEQETVKTRGCPQGEVLHLFCGHLKSISSSTI